MRIIRSVPAAALAMALGFSLPAAAHAQLSFGLGGGVTSPNSSLGTYYKTGYNAMATLGIAFLRVDGMFNQMADKTDPSGHTQIWTVNANVVANLMSPKSIVSPYLIGGVGYYNNSYRVSTEGSSIIGSGSLTQRDFGLNGGAGLRVNLAGLSLFGEARYHYVFQSGAHSQFIPVTVGIMFGN